MKSFKLPADVVEDTIDIPGRTECIRQNLAAQRYGDALCAYGKAYERFLAELPREVATLYTTKGVEECKEYIDGAERECAELNAAKADLEVAAAVYRAAMS